MPFNPSPCPGLASTTIQAESSKNQFLKTSASKLSIDLSLAIHEQPSPSPASSVTQCPSALHSPSSSSRVQNQSCQTLLIGRPS